MQRELPCYFVLYMQTPYYSVLCWALYAITAARRPTPTELVALAKAAKEPPPTFACSKPRVL